MKTRNFRKLTADRRLSLAKVFKENGNDWTYKALGEWFGSEPFAVIDKRLTSRRLAAFYFLEELVMDYSPNAIYSAADEFVQETAQNKVRRTNRSKAA